MVYGEGKTPEQLLAILKSMGGRRKRTEEEEEEEAKAASVSSRQAPSTPAAGVIVATRVSAKKHEALQSLIGKDGTELEVCVDRKGRGARRIDRDETHDWRLDLYK